MTDPKAPAKAANAANAKKQKLLRIVSKREGFRRAGMAHSEEPQFYPMDQFTKKQLEALMAEPMLLVDEVDA